MHQSFIVLEEAVIQVIRLFSFLWLWFSSCLPSDGEGYETYWSFLMEEADWGGNWVLFCWAGSCFSSVQFSCSVVSDSLQHHESQHSRPPCPSQFPEFTQTHIHRVGDAIQPSHPLSSPSPPARNSSQYQGLFQWVNSSHEVAKVLEFQLQRQSFQRTLRTDLL